MTDNHEIRQLSGGSKKNQDAYVGAPRELTIDETNQEIRLHDGQTPGGRRFLSIESLSRVFQAQNDELTGFASFDPEAKGFIVRVAPNEYRMRTLVVDEDNIALEHGNGVDGNPTIGLAPEITSSHSWMVPQTFEDEVLFANGLTGELRGPSRGTHYGPVNGEVTGNLEGDAHGNHTGTFTGVVDVRGKTFVADDGAISPSLIAGLAAFIKQHAEDSGTIKLWAGSTEDIPEGWFLCNGLNNTPDLRGKFIRGAGTGAGFDLPHTEGGEDEITPAVNVSASGEHTHTLTGQTQVSSANVSIDEVIKQVDAANQTPALDHVFLTDLGHSHDLTGTSAEGGSHTHSSEGIPQSNVPAYYALCYIMKGY